MSVKYGIPYMGSKTRIADKILALLPDGRRFVDLCGGGFAMSHAALLSGKYDSVYYNDIDPLLPPLIQDAIDGKYNYAVFKPEFITREEFFRRRDTDGYVKYIWSFGNRGVDYMFGREIEPIKHAAHDFVVFRKWNNILDEITPDLQFIVTADDINKRKEQYSECIKKVRGNQYCNYHGKSRRLWELEGLERLFRLQQQEQLNQYKYQLHTGNMYEYKHEDGDIVYIDPPYYNTSKNYSGQKFNHAEFYDWAASRPYQVYFSSNDIPDDRFLRIEVARLRYTYGGTGNALHKSEYLYTNKEW